MSLVVDASVGMKWVLPEPDSWMAHAVAMSTEKLLVPDFWLNEACNVLWVQVRKSILTPDEVREALATLRTTVQPTPTADLHLHSTALEIGLSAKHSPYVAFALAMGADRIVVADRQFTQAMSAHSDRAIAEMLMPLEDWATAHGATDPN